MSRTNHADRVLPPYAGWLDRHYVTWQLNLGRRTSLKVFAEFLGISYALLSRYLNGYRVPRPDHADQIAIRLGYDLDGHALLGLPRPDLNWLRLAQHWPHLSAEAQADLATQAERLTHLEPQ
jgi:transcriptional regulator with XRE-family HTH domain